MEFKVDLNPRELFYYFFTKFPYKVTNYTKNMPFLPFILQHTFGDTEIELKDFTTQLPEIYSNLGKLRNKLILLILHY